MENGDMVLIKWDDSNLMHGWRLEGMAQNDEVAHCRHLGIVKRETKSAVTIAFGDSDCESVSETITIPRGCITEIKKLRVK